jgi:hypothetical protein
MASSGMLRGVALVTTDVSEELSASISVCRLLVTAGVVPSSPILVTLMKEALSPCETSILRRVTLRNIPEDSILRSYRHENLKSYISLIYCSAASCSAVAFLYTSTVYLLPRLLYIYRLLAATVVIHLPSTCCLGCYASTAYVLPRLLYIYFLRAASVVIYLPSTCCLGCYISTFYLLPRLLYIYRLLAASVVIHLPSTCCLSCYTSTVYVLPRLLYIYRLRAVSVGIHLPSTCCLGCYASTVYVLPRLL